MTTVVRKEDWGVAVASGSGEVRLLSFPLIPFHFSVSDSCNILSSSSSSCFLILSSSAWAWAESSIARRRSVSGLEADVELAGLEVSLYSTSTPSGILLEWHWQDKVRPLASTAFLWLSLSHTSGVLSPTYNYVTAGATPVLNLCPIPVTLASGHYITEVPIDIIPNLLLQWHKHQQHLKQTS